MRAFFLAMALSWLPMSAAGQSCNFWHLIGFADGTSGCLTDYPIARTVPSGFSQPLRNLVVPGYSGHSVALSAGGQQCPLAVGVSAGGSLSGNGPQDPAVTRLREGIALEACEAKLRSANAGPGCTCLVGWSNNRSALTKAAFEQIVATGSTPAHVPAQAPPAQPARVQQAAAEVPASSSPIEPSAAQTQQLLQAMQQRIAELEASRAAAATPATTTTAARPLVATAPRLSARALVIGNSKYASFGALANPQRDARAIAAKLRSFGITVDLVLDANRDDLIHALNEHSRKAAGIDISILFYAGHGMQVEGINYLIPINMRADGISSGYVKLAGISLNAALDYLPAKTRLVFLDACRDNPATRTLLATRSGASLGLAPVQAASGTLLSYATRDGATADDGDGSNSPYTTALLRHLDQPVDISLVLRQVRQTVLQITSGRQEPWEYGSLVGEQIVLPLMAR